jgi:DNA-binding NtrC family response regulator
MARVLVVDDSADTRRELSRFLGEQGHEVATAGSVAEAVALGPQTFDLVMSDLRLPESDGTALVSRCHPTPVLIMASSASVRSAVRAMKLGAVDYIPKPIDRDELALSIERILREGRLRRTVDVLKTEVDRSWPQEPVVGTSPAMLEVSRRVKRVAPTRATVLVLGESGTGKELVARAIHAHSERNASPFVAVNCAAIPDSLFEPELFGHERGAFAGATAAREGLVQTADGGTLFLDEVGELPLAAQARILRLLQQSEVRRVGSNRLRRVDTRLVAATHCDLPRMIAEGSFREDLYFRLRVIQIRVPPLRERLDDLPGLASALLDRACQRLGQPAMALTEEALQELSAYHWPGNVRELENAIERAVILGDGCQIDAAALGIGELRREAALAVGNAVDAASDSSIEGYFRQFVLTHQGALNETELADRLGVSRKALWERRRRLGLLRPGGAAAKRSQRAS